jgi:hypothetical protein
MAKLKKQPKLKRNLTQALATEARERAKSEAASRSRFLRSGIRSGIEKLIPPQLRWMLPFIENLKSEQVAVEEAEATIETSPAVETPSIVPNAELYRQYRCWNGNPLSCHYPPQTVLQDPKAAYCAECGFPVTLVEKQEIRGNRGRYRIDRFLGHRGKSRLYQATLITDGQPVVIQEYLLPIRSFSEPEIQQRKAAFEQKAGVSCVDGRLQDYRLIAPWEAIADRNLERCYLVTRGAIAIQPTLGTYLKQHGAMTEPQVRHVLNQVLQTLEFLHGQKSRLPGGQVQSGLAHGNLSLESLLIIPTAEPRSGLTPLPQPQTPHPQNFFVYACDLALWESLFDSPTAAPRHPSLSQDLIDLGYVGFYLLAGRTQEPESPKTLDPKDDRHWGTTSPALKTFLLRLMEFDIPFESAEVARQALLQLPGNGFNPHTITTIEAEEEEPVTTLRPFWFLYGLVGLAVIAWLGWWLLGRSQSVAQDQSDPLLCCINKVAGVPEGSFTYTAETDSTWDYIIQRPDLIQKGTTLAQALETRQPKLQLDYTSEPSITKILAGLQPGELEPNQFAVLSLTDSLVGQLAQQDLVQKEVAYDGLVVFVAFSYAEREKSLPTRLNGQITIEQLQKLYTGQIQNWQQLGGPDLPVKLYAPAEPEALRIFKERVLRTEQNQAQFEQLLPKTDPLSRFTRSSDQIAITPKPTFEMLRSVIQDFEADEQNGEQQVGAIAFGSLSKVFGQCSVYPLAIVDGKKPSIQALIQDTGKPINPTTDLCRNKGSYRPQVQLFKTGQYPLAFPLVVVYPQDNRLPPAGDKFADMLRTQEGQLLLQQTGLVPFVELSP